MQILFLDLFFPHSPILRNDLQLGYQKLHALPKSLVTTDPVCREHRRELGNRLWEEWREIRDGMADGFLGWLTKRKLVKAQEKHSLPNDNMIVPTTKR